MFDDPKKELKKLEQQLLAEEENEWLDDQLAQAHALLGDDIEPEDMDATRIYRDDFGKMPVRNYANGYAAPRQTCDYDEQYVDEPDTAQEEAPREKGIAGLIVLALLEMLAIAVVIVYWLGQIL